MMLRKKKLSQRDIAVGLDIGSHQLKAVVVGRGDKGLCLREFIVAPTPSTLGKKGAEGEFADEIQRTLGSLGGLKTTDRRVYLCVSCSSAMVGEVEVPRMPVDEAREVVKLNSMKYLRRDLSGCHVDVAEVANPEVGDKTRKPQTVRLLVAAASNEEVQWYRTAMASAKLRLESMELAAVTVVNAFQICQTELCAKEAVLVLDIGARVTSMNFLRQGLPAMTRAMDFGGGRLTTAIAQALGLEPAGAEEEKRNLSEFMQPVVQSALMPLARELRATIDFFERQQECHLGQIFAAGGTACSPTILGLLGEAAGIKVTPWNPTANFEADNATGLEAVAPCLAAAVGAAGARLVP